MAEVMDFVTIFGQKYAPKSLGLGGLFCPVSKEGYGLWKKAQMNGEGEYM